MTRRTQKSSLQRKRQYTRGGARGKRGQWIYTVYCIMRNGVEQCFRKRIKKNNNNNNNNNNNTKKRKQQEKKNRNELEAYYRYS